MCTMEVLTRLVTLSLVAVVYSGRYVETARILGVFPTPSSSHQVVYRALTMELARRGHQLVVVTPNPINDPTFRNYTEIDISILRKDIEIAMTAAAAHDRNQNSGLDGALKMFEMSNKMSETLLDNEKFRAFTDPQNTDEHFDLVFIEWFAYPFVAALAHRFSAPMIGIISAPPFVFMNGIIGNPNNPSYITDIVLPYTDRNRTFFQRLDAVLQYLRFSNYFYNTYLPKQDEIAKRYFGPSTPYIGDLLSQVSVVFTNTIEGFHPPRPNIPSVVYINGFNTKPPKTLPKDIKEFLDSSPKGAIYFSLGSNVKSVNLPPEKRDAFLGAFAELPDYHVLWKWEADTLPGQPGNVRTVKWAPQQDVLRHPKVKVFITQGGLQSTEEAINAKVPLLAIPFLADQFYNVNLGQDRGVTLRLDFKDITKDILLKSLKKIIDDKSYAENMRRLSALVSDQQNTPMERAVWWTEYVLRHKGAAHLRTAAVDMPWYSYLLLDVALFLLGTALLALALLWVAVKFVWSKARQLLLTPQKQKTN